MTKNTQDSGNFVSRWTKAIKEMPSTYQHPAATQPAQATAADKPPVKKLTDAQKRVMKWIGRGWQTEPGAGSAIHVNGKRICNVDTMMSLQRLGLASKVDEYHWAATPAGKAYTAEHGL